MSKEEKINIDLSISISPKYYEMIKQRVKESSKDISEVVELIIQTSLMRFQIRQEKLERYKLRLEKIDQ